MVNTARVLRITKGTPFVARNNDGIFHCDGMIARDVGGENIFQRNKGRSGPAACSGVGGIFSGSGI